MSVDVDCVVAGRHVNLVWTSGYSICEDHFSSPSTFVDISLCQCGVVEIYVPGYSAIDELNVEVHSTQAAVEWLGGFANGGLIVSETSYDFRFGEDGTEEIVSLNDQSNSHRGLL